MRVFFHTLLRIWLLIMEGEQQPVVSHEFTLADFLGDPITKKGKFRLKSSMLFVTYPKCTMSKNDVLREVSKKKKFDLYMICQELHEDGSPHIHMILKNHKIQFDITSERALDLGQFHGNIKKILSGVGHLERVCGYLRKYDTSVLTNFKPHEEYSTKQGVYKEALACTSRKRAREIIKEGDPEGYFKSYTNVEKVLKTIIEPLEPYVMPSKITCPFVYPAEVRKWMSQIGTDELRYKLLVIRGTAELGKTHMMRSIDPYHVYCHNYIDLDKLKCTGYKYVILDDISWGEGNSTFSMHPENVRWLLLGMRQESTTRQTWAQWSDMVVNVPCCILMNHEKGAFLWNYLHKHKEWSKVTIFLDLPDHARLYTHIQLNI